MATKKDLLKVIRSKCLDCCAGQANEVRLCELSDCVLFPYRFAKDPNHRKREMAEEQRAVLSERMKALRMSQSTANGKDVGCS